MPDNKPGNAYYDPSTAAAILFAVLFGLSTATHLLQGIGYKKVRTDYSHMKIASSRKMDHAVWNWLLTQWWTDSGLHGLLWWLALGRRLALSFVPFGRTILIGIPTSSPSNSSWSSLLYVSLIEGRMSPETCWRLPNAGRGECVRLHGIGPDDAFFLASKKDHENPCATDDSLLCSFWRDVCHPWRRRFKIILLTESATAPLWSKLPVVQWSLGMAQRPQETQERPFVSSHSWCLTGKVHLLKCRAMQLLLDSASRKPSSSSSSSLRPSFTGLRYSPTNKRSVNGHHCYIRSTRPWSASQWVRHNGMYSFRLLTGV